MRSQAFSSPAKRGLVGLAVAGLVAALCLLLIPGGPEAAKGQGEATATVAKKKKKKKKKPVKVMTQNLYLGADLGPIVAAANEGQVPSGNPLADTAAQLAAPDHFINEVGFALKDIETNNFRVRAQTIANDIKKNKADVVGLQEVALFKLEIPTDGGGPPRGSSATVPLIDYSDTLLDALNAKAKTKKQCKKKGLKGDKCYRGYTQVTLQQEADLEQPGDFDNDPGPNGIGGNGPAFDTTPPFPHGPGAPSAANARPGPPCQNGWFEGTPGEGLNDPETNPGADDTGAFAQDPGPPNTTVTDPVTGEVVRFDYNGDSFSNFRNNGNIGTQALSCGPDTLAGSIFTVPQTLDPETGWGPYASDCPDNNPIGGSNTAPDPPIDKSDTTSSCALHGIDGDLRLQIRDAIIVRKGAGVKTRNPQGGNFGHFLQLPILGGAATVNFTRGWTSVQATVRGRSFHFLNTHLESEEIGTVREDQASELIGPGTPGAVNKTVLVGDLNSDPSVTPGSSENALAFNMLAAAGYVPLTASANTFGHAEILNNPNDNTFTKRIDWIMTNSPSITMRSSRLTNTFANGLWGSDHAGVLSVLNVPGKKGKKKK